jgi:three-Cys-motif partner protein
MAGKTTIVTATKKGNNVAEVFEYDEIGYWSEIKLDIFKKYASAYTTIMHAHPSIKKYIYIDAFAGSGLHYSKNKSTIISGSPINALSIETPFSEMHLIDLHRGKVSALRKKIGLREDVFTYEDDANEVLLKNIFPRCRYEDFHRALCVLDPYGLSVNWSVLQEAGKMRSIDVFYNFMIMDANMNIFLHDPNRVTPEQVKRMDKVWGDHSWREIAYFKKQTLWGEVIDEKQTNDKIAEAFRTRLEKIAGFQYVPKPISMCNTNRSTIYYLYFASCNKTGANIATSIFNNYRDRGIV